MKASVRALAIITAVGAATGHAATSSSSTPALTSAGDAIKEGDEIRLSADAPVFHSLDTTKQQPFCVPAGSRFHVNHIDAPSSKIGATDDKGNPVTTSATVKKKPDGSTETTIPATGNVSQVTQVTSDTSLYVYVPTAEAAANYTLLHWWRTWFPPLKIPATESNCTSSNEASKTPVVAAGTEYTVSAQDLQKYGSVRAGFTWGAMVIPYKFETSDHSFQAVPTAAGYVGYEGWWPGVSLAHVLALGGGASSSTQNAPSGSPPPASGGSNSSSGTHATYTIALGEMATLGGSFKAGVLVGRDYQGANTGFKYEGKTWVAVSVGAGF
ncbi:MAG TPA: hypothetical protein VNX02_11460 [Steroidobacteraceae bacterium]|nr:hypothetical protein [Steroidobacteraceae bacterium]